MIDIPWFCVGFVFGAGLTAYAFTIFSTKPEEEDVIDCVEVEPNVFEPVGYTSDGLHERSDDVIPAAQSLGDLVKRVQTGQVVTLDDFRRVSSRPEPLYLTDRGPETEAEIVAK